MTSHPRPGVCPECGKYSNDIYNHRMNAHGYRILNFTEEELEALEAKNFSNMVYFYGAELREILEGKMVGLVFTQAERTNLYKLGILEHLKGRARGNLICVTETAQAFLVSSEGACPPSVREDST